LYPGIQSNLVISFLTYVHTTWHNEKDYILTVCKHRQQTMTNLHH